MGFMRAGQGLIAAELHFLKGLASQPVFIGSNRKALYRVAHYFVAIPFTNLNAYVIVVRFLGRGRREWV